MVDHCGDEAEKKRAGIELDSLDPDISLNN
jgi:hypothetical protein